MGHIIQSNLSKVKGKGIPYSIRAYGARADPDL